MTVGGRLDLCWSRPSRQVLSNATGPLLLSNRLGAPRPLSGCERSRRGMIRSNLPEAVVCPKSTGPSSWLSPFLSSLLGSCRSSSQERASTVRRKQRIVDIEAAYEPQSHRHSCEIRALHASGTIPDDPSASLMRMDSSSINCCSVEEVPVHCNAISRRCGIDAGLSDDTRSTGRGIAAKSGRGAWDLWLESQTGQGRTQYSPR